MGSFMPSQVVSQNTTRRNENPSEGDQWRWVRVFITDSPATGWWALVDLVYEENEDIPNGSKWWKHV